MVRATANCVVRDDRGFLAVVDDRFRRDPDPSRGEPQIVDGHPVPGTSEAARTPL